jgi:hypothetical protein
MPASRPTRVFILGRLIDQEIQSLPPGSGPP